MLTQALGGEPEPEEESEEGPEAPATICSGVIADSALQMYVAVVRPSRERSGSMVTDSIASEFGVVGGGC